MAESPVIHALARDKPKGRRGSVKQAVPVGVPVPDRKLFEVKNKELTEEIDRKEKLIKHTSSDGYEFSSVLKAKSDQIDRKEDEKANINKEVKMVEQRVKQLGTEVQQQKDAAYRQLAGLRYRNAQSYDDQIRKLNHQLSSGPHPVDCHFRAKVEAEVVKMQQSKEKLREYLSVKEEIDRKVDEQESLRKRRDSLYRERKKVKEDVIKLRDELDEVRLKAEERKSQQKDEKAQQDVIRNEIDMLYKQRKELREAFHQAQTLYSEEMRKMRAAQYQQEREEAQRKEEERRLLRETRKKQREFEKEHRQEQETEQEKLICRTLINYLNGNLSSSTTTTTTTITTTTSEASSDVPNGGARVVSGKKDEVEWLPSSGRRRSRRDRKKSSSSSSKQKRLQHNPTTLYQFSLLRMNPPMCQTDVPLALSELNAKLKFFENSFRAQSEAGDSGICELSDRSNGDCASGQHTPTLGKAGESPSPSPCHSPSEVDLKTTEIDQLDAIKTAQEIEPATVQASDNV